MKTFDVYSLYDIEPVRGKGTRVYTSDGTEYIDFYGGHAVISVGHAHPHYVDAICEQVASLGFYSNSVNNSLQIRLAELLGRVSGYDDYQLFLSNSGAEANENAIKAASFHTGRKKLLAFCRSFHGRTSGAVAATDNPKIVSPFNETENVDFCELNNADMAREMLASGEYCAAIIEGIQGVAGIIEPTDDFLLELKSLTQTNGTLLIADEIQSGYGRTGDFFAHQRSGVKADIVTCAKGMANGFPIGATILSPDIKPVKGMLGTTFGGNHLACAAAIAVLEIIEKERLVDNAKEVGLYLKDKLSTLPGLKDLRGRGLMLGAEIDGSASEFRKRLLFEQKVFTGGAGAHTIRLLPALCVTKDDVDLFINRIEPLLNETLH